MAFEGVIRRPVYLQVAEQLREAILEGELEPGAVLPAERELTGQFGVSRTSVREALRALQAQGLVVESGPTAPLRVAAPEALSTGPIRETLVHLMRLGRVPLTDLVELRCALEAAAAERAARRLPHADLGAAHDELEVMRTTHDDFVAFEQADVRFHVALVVASGNEALHLVMLAVRDSIAGHLLQALAGLPDAGPTLVRLTAEHEAILTAIERRDPAEAGERMRDHVLGFYDR
jgi:DNA-binding FadR family transcriptional regulator